MESGNNKHGTTLIEILVVIAVIMILAGLTAGIGTTIDRYSKEKAVKATLSLLDAALEEYYDFKRGFPVAVDAAPPQGNCEIMYFALSSVPGSREVLDKVSDNVKKNLFNPGIVPAVYEIYDPWGTVLNYTYNSGDSFPRLTSAGPDRNWATVADNITNR